MISSGHEVVLRSDNPDMPIMAVSGGSVSRSWQVGVGHELWLVIPGRPAMAVQDGSPTWQTGSPSSREVRQAGPERLAIQVGWSCQTGISSWRSSDRPAGQAVQVGWSWETGIPVGESRQLPSEAIEVGWPWQTGSPKSQLEIKSRQFRLDDPERQALPFGESGLLPWQFGVDGPAKWHCYSFMIFNMSCPQLEFAWVHTPRTTW
jgi:hypothetical protein